jgi:hypothetical protein
MIPKTRNPYYIMVIYILGGEGGGYILFVVALGITYLG